MEPSTPFFRVKVKAGTIERSAGFSLYYAEAIVTGPTVTQLNAMLEDVKTIVMTYVLPMWPEEVELQRVTMQCISPTQFYEIDAAIPAATTGTASATELLPYDSAVCIQRRSAHRGRSKIGRIFIPFVSEIFQINSYLTDAGLDIYDAFADQMGTALSDTGAFLHPATIDWKNGLVLGVVNTNVNRVICSRADRRVSQMPVFPSFAGTTPLG